MGPIDFVKSGKGPTDQKRKMHCKRQHKQAILSTAFSLGNENAEGTLLIRQTAVDFNHLFLVKIAK